MEVQDGFIVSVFNYCDRWCERCPFTSRCRVFADIVEHDFERDHGPLTEPMIERQERRLAKHAARWEKELGIDFAEIEREAAKNPDVGVRAEIKFDHLELHERASDFCRDMWKWLEGRESNDPIVREALEVVTHFGFFVPSKVRRALQGIAEDEVLGPCDDADGSAKAALIGLEKMLVAWERLETAAYPLDDLGRSLIDTTRWMIPEIEKHLPKARAFVRPGFDEPDEVRMLNERER